MIPTDYYENYAKKPNAEIVQRAKVKEEELKKILKEVPFHTAEAEIKVAVLGCGDKRFVPQHRGIFEKLLAKPVDLTTFDVEVEHLVGKLGVVQHDVTLPLPGAPFDIAYSHVLLKFVETDKQYEVIKNSFDALRAPGLAIHIFDNEEIIAKTKELPDGLSAVPIELWQQKLRDEGIEIKFIPLSVEGILPEPVNGAALVLIKK